MTERAVPAMTGESQVEEPRTEAGALERTVAGRRLSDKASGLWWQPNPLAGANAMQSATSDVRAAIRAIEDEARAAAFVAAADAVIALRYSDEGIRCPAKWRCVLPVRGEPGATHVSYASAAERASDVSAHFYIEHVDRAAVLAAITALRQPQEVKDTRGEPR